MQKQEAATHQTLVSDAVRLLKNIVTSRATCYVLATSYPNFSLDLHANNLHENVKQPVVGHDVLRDGHQVAGAVGSSASEQWTRHHASHAGQGHGRAATDGGNRSRIGILQ